jgi:HEPN domain-containing protein
VPRARRTRADPSSAHRYLHKAKQFADEAHDAAGHRRWDAAVVCAVHAGISAADAFTAALAGVRSTDPDHLRVVDLLREVGRGARGVDAKAQQLSAVLGLKNRIEYEDKLAKETDATTAIDRADRIVAWSLDQVSKIGA